MSDAEWLSLDANILVYAVDVDAGDRQERALQVLDRARSRPCMLAVQTLGEFYTVATRKKRVPPRQAATVVRDWMAMFPVVGNDAEAIALALPAAEAGRFSYWDALLLATLARAGCSTLLSEDMADGSTLAGVTVRNPFAGEVVPATVVRLLGG